MSRGDGRALQAAARAIYGVWQGAAPDWTDEYVPDNETREDAQEAAEAAYDAILDALLSELPEEAVEAAATEIAHAEVPEHYPATPEEMAPHYVDSAVLQITAFLLSLRSSSRGPNR